MRDPADRRLRYGEEYEVEGYVNIRIHVCYRTNSEPGTSRWEADLADAVDYAVENDDWQEGSDFGEGLDIHVVDREM